MMHPGLSYSLWWTWVICALIWGHLLLLTSATIPNAPAQFNVVSKSAVLELPLSISVMLLGLNEGDIQLDPEVLKRGFEEVLPTHTPHCVALSEKMGVSYRIAYDVVHSSSIRSFESTVLRPSFERQLNGNNSAPFSVDIEQVDSFLESLVSNSTAGEYTVFILHPNLQRLTSDLLNNSSITPPLYYYRFGSSIPFTSWIGPQRYVVRDLTAGPVYHGRGETVPAMPPELLNPEYSKEELEQLVGLTVVSAVHHVFSSDIMFDHIHYAEKVLVPVIVLRDHRLYNPFKPWGYYRNYSIDVDTIGRELQKLALPNQRIDVMSGLHALHEHPALSVALFQSLRSFTTVKSQQVSEVVEYSDGKELLAALRDGGDLLVSGLLGEPDLSNYQPLGPATPPTSSSIAAVTVGDTGPPLSGTYILPVFVLCLHDFPKDILIDRDSMLAVAHDMIVVLQSDCSSTALPFYAEEKPVFCSPEDTTRHVVAGVAQALGGVVPPYQKFSDLYGVIVEDYLWAHGYHPFGPFSKFCGLSLALRDAVIRNGMISQLGGAVTILRDSVDKLESFLEKYPILPEKDDVWWPHRFFVHRPSTPSHLMYSTLNTLFGELGRMCDFLRPLQRMSSEEFLQRYQYSPSFKAMASRWSRYIEDYLDTQAAKLDCYELFPVALRPTSSLLGSIVFVVFAVLALVLWRRFGSSTKVRPRRMHGSIAHRKVFPSSIVE